MAVIVSFYRGGLQRLTPETWAARADDEVLLIEHGTGWTFDQSDATLTDLVLGATELTATGYARQSLTPGTPVFGSGRWTLPLAALTWTALGTSELLSAVVGFEAGASDATSVPLWCIRDSGSAAIVTLDGTDCTVTTDLGMIS